MDARPTSGGWAAWRARLRAALFQALYTRLAPFYDHIAAVAFAGEWRRWTAIACNLVDAEPVLELGCGAGDSLALLRARGLAAIGLDLSPEMLALAAGHAPGSVACARAQALPTPTGAIGTVLSIFPTSYILDPATWREIERVLRPGGRVIVIDHGWLSPRDPIRALLCGLHVLVYGQIGAPPAVLAAHAELPLLTLTERSAHGFVSVAIGQRAR